MTGQSLRRNVVSLCRHTRAKERGHYRIPHAHDNGETHYSKVSRFVDEIPEKLIQMEKLEPRVSRSVNQDEYDDDTLPWNKTQSRLGISKFGMKSNSYASRTASYVSGNRRQCLLRLWRSGRTGFKQYL